MKPSVFMGHLRAARMVTALIVAVLIMAACQAAPVATPVGTATPTQGTASPTAEPTLEPAGSVSFGVLRAPTGALAVVTDENGWYEEAGVDVEFISFAEGGGPAIIQAMGGGSPDLALLNLATTVLALGQGTFDVQIVSIAANPGAALPLLGAAEIESVEDLRGRRVSAPQGGGQYYLLAAILDKHGMTFDDIDYRPLPIGEAQAAFLTGQLDAVISSVNGTVLIQQNAPETNVLFDGTDFAPEDAYFSPDVIIATREAVDSNPEGIRRFLAAFHGQGVEFLNDAATRDQALGQIQAYMTSVGAGVEEVELTRAGVDAIEFYGHQEAADLLSDDSFIAAINRQVQFWIDNDVIEEAPDVEGAVDTTLIQPR
jgi:ABC-type nitrate/sulfonate/bicarbonate transport system substrate-binding protein